MCDTCGCGQGNETTYYKPGETLHHTHDHMHKHGDREHSHPHTHGHSHVHANEDIDTHHTHKPRKHGPNHEHRHTLTVQTDIMSRNNMLAERNRGWFEGREVIALNLVSSPGSGKTTLLEKTIEVLKEQESIYIIEGDQRTAQDAERIAAAGAAVVQINTGNGCHLDAHMVQHAVEKLKIQAKSYLFIENVGNLVCPSLFDLGENKRVVIISTTEGEDKPLKYPTMFETSHLCIINKTDLLPHVDFDIEQAKAFALQVNPKLQFIELSAKTGEGMDAWKDWLLRQKMN